MYKYLFFIAMWFLYLPAAYPQAGTLDETFADGGVYKGYPPEARLAYGIDICMQSDGKILVAGNATSLIGGISYIFVARLNPDGTMDPTFNDDGFRGFGYGDSPASYAHCIGMQSDGKIMIGGHVSFDGSEEEEILLVRLNSDGTVDYTFAFNGYLVLDLSLHNDQLRNFVVQDDGKIIAVARAGTNMNPYSIIMRLNPDGSFDDTFGDAGMVTVDIGIEKTYLNSIVVQPDGKYLAAGAIDNTTEDDDIPLLVRYNADGTPDEDFGVDGIALSEENINYSLYTIALLPDGNFFVSYVFNLYATGVFQFTNSGLINYSFSPPNGRISVGASPTGSLSRPNILLESDNKFIVTGSESGDVYVARYTMDGEPDESFGSEGAFHSTFDTRLPFIPSAILQPDSKILFTGTIDSNVDTTKCLVVRLLNDDALTFPDIKQNNTVRISPNPAGENLFITAAGFDAGEMKIDIYNITGQNIKTFSVMNSSELQLDIADLPSGIYTINLSDAGKSIADKFVKQ